MAAGSVYSYSEAQTQQHRRAYAQLCVKCRGFSFVDRIFFDKTKVNLVRKLADNKPDPAEIDSRMKAVWNLYLAYLSDLMAQDVDYNLDYVQKLFRITNNVGEISCSVDKIVLLETQVFPLLRTPAAYRSKMNTAIFLLTVVKEDALFVYVRTQILRRLQPIISDPLLLESDDLEQCILFVNDLVHDPRKHLDELAADDTVLLGMSLEERRRYYEEKIEHEDPSEQLVPLWDITSLHYSNTGLIEVPYTILRLFENLKEVSIFSPLLLNGSYSWRDPSFSRRQEPLPEKPEKKEKPTNNTD